MLLYHAGADDDLLQHVFAEPAVAVKLVATCRDLRTGVLSHLLQGLRDARLAHLFERTEASHYVDPFCSLPRSVHCFANLDYCDWSQTPMSEHDVRAAAYCYLTEAPRGHRLGRCLAKFGPRSGGTINVTGLLRTKPLQDGSGRMLTSCVDVDDWLGLHFADSLLRVQPAC